MMHFAGMQNFEDPGLVYPTDFRKYNPALGRWMSPDPLAGDVTNPQSLNRYAYVLNNPVSNIDPTGLSCVQAADGHTYDNGDGKGCTQVDVVGYLSDDDYIPVGLVPGPGLVLPGNNHSSDGGSVDLSLFNLSDKGKVCEAKIENALNSALNTSAQFKGPELQGNTDPSEPGLINGAYNFNYFVPGVNVLARGVLPSCGRFDSRLHVIVPGKCNPSGDPFTKPYGFNAQQNGSYITAHIDSANPYADLASFILHLFKDVLLKSPHGC